MVARKPGGPYQCPLCKAVYPHDGGFVHEVYDCPKRKEAGNGR